MGALGDPAAFARLAGLKVCLVGASRGNSLVAENLARLGIAPTLIDPDVTEDHHLGEINLLTAADVGRPKAEALAGHLQELLSEGAGSPLPIVASITDRDAIAAAIACDVLITWVDNDAAHLAAAILATMYHKVGIHIGTGIRFEPGQSAPALNSQLSTLSSRSMGADVRLIIPGDGCLLCRGNLTNYERAVEELCNPRATANRPTDWRRQRAGSLRSLNAVAAGLGVQMLLDLVAERLQGSTWAHLEFDQAGRLSVTYPQIGQDNGQPCALCAKAGLGDDGLGIADSDFASSM